MSFTQATALHNLDPAHDSTFQAASPTFIDSIHVDLQKESPLAKLKLTYWPIRNESSLFLSWANVLGDEESAYGFLHTVNRLYLCQPPLLLPFTRQAVPRALAAESRSSISSRTPRDKKRRDIESIELIINQKDLGLGSMARDVEHPDVTSRVRQHLARNISDAATRPVINSSPIRDLRHLHFTDITFALSSPSLPPKRSRFYFIDSPNDYIRENVIRLWPGNPPNGLEDVRVCFHGSPYRVLKVPSSETIHPGAASLESGEGQVQPKHKL